MDYLLNKGANPTIPSSFVDKSMMHSKSLNDADALQLYLYHSLWKFKNENSDPFYIMKRLLMHGVDINKPVLFRHTWCYYSESLVPPDKGSAEKNYENTFQLAYEYDLGEALRIAHASAQPYCKVSTVFADVVFQ
jgi:hypothetical protein